MVECRVRNVLDGVGELVVHVVPIVAVDIRGAADVGEPCAVRSRLVAAARVRAGVDTGVPARADLPSDRQGCRRRILSEKGLEHTDLDLLFHVGAGTGVTRHPAGRHDDALVGEGPIGDGDGEDAHLHPVDPDRNGGTAIVRRRGRRERIRDAARVGGVVQCPDRPLHAALGDSAGLSDLELIIGEHGLRGGHHREGDDKRREDEQAHEGHG